MSNEVFDYIAEHLKDAQNEEEVRLAWYGGLALKNIFLNAERQKNDASFNQVIIEFKDKGLFRGRTNSPKFKEAVYDRLCKYIKRKSSEQGLPEEEYTGIATDGDHIAFCFMVDGNIIHQNLMPLSEVSVDKVYKSLQSDTRRALTPQNLIEDFGHASYVGRSLMGALSNELTKHFHATENNKIKMLFKEWQTLFGQVASLTCTQKAQIKKAINFKVPDIGVNEESGLLFVVHTYNALIMKLLGAEIVSYIDLTQYKDFCGNLASSSDENILTVLDNDIEKSALFDSVGIKGFVEEAIFSWYLDAKEKHDKANIIASIKEALIQISLYRMDDLTAARSRDVLKTFYQALVPDVLRKSLGEFYTPDWLVDTTCDKAGIQKWLPIRVLDPTCGSGSFLLNAISRKRKEAEAIGMSEEEVLDNIISNVWGFDLNPLAVQAARVNFLIAISDLFVKCKGKEIELPVLLADSVYSPAESPKNSCGAVNYRIGSTQADLLISLPSELAFDRTRLDSVFEIMGCSVDENIEFNSVEQKLIRRKVVSEQELQDWYDVLENTYKRVLSLHRKNWNGIWFRIVRNFFWSATAGSFDLVLGNPPWVRWSNLPEDYRQKVKPTCMKYTIFSNTKFHGGNELDISGMITYTVSDKWLKDNGKLVFVITQTHFQSPSSQGFRSFEINKDTMLVPTSVDDLKELKPFAGAANKTAIACFEKT
ncbi:N-6 DNA methylase [Endozoicomonas sp. Mp262]|uniref:Eco57I restriction-modification methylase domain-containing protein n=1 Tax=Endozoicomonas sp. Mp262 TaxID=2919499 RepID=UPI0021E0A662